MKRIACLNSMLISSEDPKASEQLIDMFNNARIYNKEQKVRGVVLAAKDVMLQIFEGESNTLAELVYRLGRDTMTKNTSVILSCDIDEPFFSSWQIKLMNERSEKNERYLKKIQTAISSQVNVVKSLDKQRLAYFFVPNQHNSNDSLTAKDNQKAQNITEKISTFWGCSLSLSAWPKPSQLKPTAESFKLCSYLSRRKLLYQDLLARGIFASQEALDEHLEYLVDLGLLISNLQVKKQLPEEKLLAKPVKATPPSSGTRHKSGSSDRFSQVLRKFIASTKRVR